ncbi:MAG: SDR family NAD(P)-dependent oxidoreductase [Chloroflexota bacterium]
MENMNFAGKIVLVTGASRGIGRAIARQFAGHGARVAVHYNNNLGAAQETMASLPGGPHMIVQAESADPKGVEEMISAVTDEMGALDIVVNNAGIYEEHPLAAVAYEEWQDSWQQTLATNLIGPANISYCAARYMIAQGGGRIVNVSSRGAFRGEPTAPAYGASKAGLNAMSPLGRVATPEEVAYAVLFLASPEAAFMTGAIIDVNGASYLRS